MCVYVHACNLNRKLEQQYKDSMTTLRAELSKEVELVQQQANQQRDELELEIGKMREDETFLREHLSLTIKVISILLFFFFLNTINCLLHVRITFLSTCHFNFDLKCKMYCICLSSITLYCIGKWSSGVRAYWDHRETGRGRKPVEQSAKKSGWCFEREGTGISMDTDISADMRRNMHMSIVTSPKTHQTFPTSLTQAC